MATVDELRQYLQNPNVRRVLDVISKAEGTDTHGYATAFGGGKLDSLADHPRQLYDFTQTDGKANKTSAAGRYQFLQRTWDDVAGRLGLRDFSPESQDLAAIELLRRAGALEPASMGDFQTALQRSGGTWASLPSSPYAQPKRSPGFIAQALDSAAQAIFPSAQAAQGIDPNMVQWDDEPSGKIDASQVQWDDGPQEVPQTSASVGSDGVTRVEMAHEEPKEATLAQKIQGSMPGRFIQGGRDILDAGAQMLANAVPESVADALNTGVRAVNDLPVIGPVTKALGMTPASAQELGQQIGQNEQQYQAARQAVGDTGFDTARLAGNVLATAPMAAASVPAAAATIPARIAAAGGAGALFGGLQPVTEGDYASNKLQQMALGAAVSGGLSGVGNSLARLVSPKASTNPQVQRLLDEGVTPTPGQIMGGAARTAEDRAMSVPIVGDAIRSARKRGIEELNRAALNRAMAPLGGKVNNIGREGMREVGDAISSAYDDLLPKLSFRADGQFSRELGQLQQMAQSMPPGQAQQFENIVRSQVASRMTQQGGATGQAYKEIESEIGRLARSYLSSANAGERQLGTALAELQNSLRSALSRANPGSAKELAKINEAYANFVRLQRAAGMVGADDGIFTPAQLSSAVRASDKSMRKGKYARGEALMQDLSDAGRSVMSGTIPNSGTADRLMLSAGALGTGLYNPLIPAGLMAASIPYLGGVNRLAAAALARRPGFAPQIAEGVRSVIPAAGVVATQMMNPALQQ